MGQRLHHRLGARDGGSEHDRDQARRPRAVADRERPCSSCSPSSSASRSPSINLDLLAFSGYPSFSKIIASVALTFFAYLGINVITFTAATCRKPSHDLPRAMYGALQRHLARLRADRDQRVRDAHRRGGDRVRRDRNRRGRRPALGDAGFTVMAVAALLATAGATNATLYASSNLTGMLAKSRAVSGLLRAGLPTRRAKPACSITAGLVPARRQPR